MKLLQLLVAVLICAAFSADSWAQSNWSWKRWNLFAKNKESVDVEPVEITDEPASSTWTNPLSDGDVRPRSIEWRTPPFIRRMNESNAKKWRESRRSFSHWASSTGTTIRNSANDTWEAITRATTPKPKTDPNSSIEPAPRFGGVNEFLSRPKLKF